VGLDLRSTAWIIDPRVRHPISAPSYVALFHSKCINMPRVRADKHTLQLGILEFIPTTPRENCGLLDTLHEAQQGNPLCTHELSPFSAELRAVSMPQKSQHVGMLWPGRSHHVCLDPSNLRSSALGKHSARTSVAITWKSSRRLHHPPSRSLCAISTFIAFTSRRASIDFDTSGAY
jgi:hypothetical protein